MNDLTIYRIHVSGHYETLSDRIGLAIKIKYWWNGTHPDLIDDELGQVIDGQFFGPKWLRNPIYKVTDMLDFLAARKRNKWALRWLTKGKQPSNFWLRRITPPYEPSREYYESIFFQDDEA